jgi:hypothetical protein
MVDLEGRALVAMARWGPEVHQQSIWNYRHKDGVPVSATDDLTNQPGHDLALGIDHHSRLE